jgi:AraC-like DNA-binding protein
MLVGARKTLGPGGIGELLQKVEISDALIEKHGARITREQFVRLYEAVALATGDEMLGLWSRPIRGGTLKYLGQSMLDAPTVFTAMYRFTKFWNLLLDDDQLEFSCDEGIARLALVSLMRGVTPVVFGHELMVKLIHGIASWLIGRQLHITGVGFGFPRPPHFSEYAELFPGPVQFDQAVTFVAFDEQSLRQRFHRTKRELLEFVKRAPDDWIFVTFDHGGTRSRVRAFLSDKPISEQDLSAASRALGMSDRTLSRKLASEQTSFQKVRDEVRRDIAVHKLVKTNQSICEIAASVGFDNTPAFYRAFRTWKGGTPSRLLKKSFCELVGV